MPCMRNLEKHQKQFFEKGWCRFDYDQRIADWVDAALPEAHKAIASPDNAKWLRCGGTWFVGVNVLPNDGDGVVKSGPVLQGDVVDFIHETLMPAPVKWDAGQVSTVYPGYPQPMESESEKAFQFRYQHDAAHVDGLLPEGPERRRHLREFHGFILGIPMVEYSEENSACAVWGGSHEKIRSALETRFAGIATSQWPDQDITDSYQSVRRQIFDECRRVPVVARPGEAYLMHRLLLHGISPWRQNENNSVDQRMICYLRPELNSAEDWVNNP
ncbi:MAG: hypothetical protein GY763_09570 [Gammaproteobacteria bacterium]|nr:hypothetical protein [Gammaproteobacteria bacterium]